MQKYSLLLTIHPNALFPHVRVLDPKPAQTVVDRSVPMTDARRKTIDEATMPLSLILDADTLLPSQFLPRGIKKLAEGFVACTLLYSPNTQGHPPFGASLWRTDKLKQLYDYQAYVRNYEPIYARTEDKKGNDSYKITNPLLCECLYMYAKLGPNELHVFTNLTAQHLKGKPFKAEST